MGPGQLIKTLLPRGLFGRSLMIIILPLVLVQVISTYVFFNSHMETVTRRMAGSLAGDIATMVALMGAYPNDIDALCDLTLRSMDVDFDWFPGAILPNTPAEREEGFLSSALSQAMEERLQRPFRLDLSRERDLVVNVQLPDGLLRMTASRKRLYSSTTTVFVLWMVGSSMILFGVAVIFMRNQVRAVRRLAAAAHAFGKGRDVADFKPEGAAEVRQAATAFNLMRERLRRQIAQRTEMLAGVSHDLRTPLTRMKLQLAMMSETEGVAELGQDVAEMECMVEGYLAFARGDGAEAVALTELKPLLEEVVAGFGREGATIDLHCEGAFTMPLRPQAFRRCVTNLIANSCRFARHVSVRAGRRGEAVEVTVDDDGPGIPADKREDVFKAFVRLEGSRNRATGGVGLGLTIARDVVRGLGGDILLEDSPFGGLRARMRLPL